MTRSLSSPSAPKITFQALQERFIAGLDQRLGHLKECLATLRGPIDDARTSATVDKLVCDLHTLVGIGGTYGFDEISEAARIGTKAAESLEFPVTAEEIAAMSMVIDALDMAALAARRRTPVR